MSRKYALCPGYVRSQFDGDEHYINKRQLTNTQPYFLGVDYTKEIDKCLHKNCPECHGTGVKLNGGICIHMISCPCPRCTPRC